MRNTPAFLVCLVLAACTSKSAPSTPPIDDCEPNEFLGCAGDSALRCDPEGTGSVMEACGASGCNEAAGRCNECVASTATCAGDAVETCGADGLVAASESCAAGCRDDGDTARCKHIVPVWIPDACDAPPAIAARVLTGTLNTSDATACTRVIQQKLPSGTISGPEICVVSAGSIEIKELEVIGTRAIAFVGDAVTVTGLLDVNASAGRSGPGAYLTNGEYDTTFGGGGAGFRHAGANGGGNEFGALFRQGGATRDPLDEQVFSGGTRAGDDPGPFTPADDGVAGGGGGGALLVACRDELNVVTNGIISASGGGGMKGVGSHGGAGGGSGGYIVLQGAKVKVSGRITVNGGGGGASCVMSPMCLDGADGFGFGGGSGEGGNGGKPGGRGGKGDQLPQAGTNHETGVTGGGGGSVGRVQVYTPAGVAPTLAPLEPVSFEPNLTVPTR